ncbi:mucin-5B-like [Procambarus clarkii]|uniref:mucin-5B-like n=1 Tax=Procambarus clarkii TaxID=6728 RepID=UPI00374452F5
MPVWAVYSWLLLAVLHLSTKGLSVNVSSGGRCCYGERRVQHGEVVLSLPDCCLTLVCLNGHIERKYVGGPGESHCCEFEGLMYVDGSKLSAHCIPLQCAKGVWTPTQHIEDCCKHCYLYNDPHIETFDQFRYDWHGICNYSVAQSDLTYTPEVGVFSDFDQCNGHASCLSRTTFRDNPHTVITLDSGSVFDITVNGDLYTVPASGAHAVVSSAGAHPVLAWRDGGCIYLLGSSKIVLQHCRHRLDVWAYPSHINHLDGLCGHFNFYKNDDFTDRDQRIHALNFWPLAFPESWRTKDQTDRTCYKCLDCQNETAVDPCEATPLQQRADSALCRRLLHPIIGKDLDLQTHVETCAWDVCMMRGARATERELADWLLQLQIILQQTKLILARTLDGWEARPTPVVGSCEHGSRWLDKCNWCSCSDTGVAGCTRKACVDDYEPKLGSEVCINGSRWMKDACNWCECVRGGAICTFTPCNILDCPLIKCGGSCTPGKDPLTGCPTCNCTTTEPSRTRTAPQSTTCPPLACPDYCRVVTDVHASCPTCSCNCPVDPSTGRPPCPLNCGIIYTFDEAGCEVCVCDPENPGNPLVDYGKELLAPEPACPTDPTTGWPLCPEGCDVKYQENVDTGCKECVCY